MRAYHEYEDHLSSNEYNYEEDMQDAPHRREVRRQLENRLERKRLKEALEDDFDTDFDWSDYE